MAAFQLVQRLPRHFSFQGTLILRWSDGCSIDLVMRQSASMVLQVRILHERSVDNTGTSRVEYTVQQTTTPIPCYADLPGYRDESTIPWPGIMTLDFFLTGSAYLRKNFFALEREKSRQAFFFFCQSCPDPVNTKYASCKRAWELRPGPGAFGTDPKIKTGETDVDDLC